MGRVTYRRSNGVFVVLGVVILAVGVVPTIYIAIIDDDARTTNLVAAGVFLLGGAALLALLFVSTPHRIEVSDDVFRAVSVFRTREFRWSELRSVSSPWYASNRVVWLSDGGKVATGRDYVGFYNLLAEVPIRAPHAEIRNVC